MIYRISEDNYAAGTTIRHCLSEQAQPSSHCTNGAFPVVSGNPFPETAGGRYPAPTFAFSLFRAFAIKICFGSLALAAAVLAFAARAPAAPAATQQMDASGQPVVCRSIGIDDAIRIALRDNPSVASRRALVEAAAARVGMAKAMGRPRVSTSTFGTLGNMPMVVPGSPNVGPQDFSLTGDEPRLDQNLMAMYPLYTGGNLKGRVSSAQAQQVASSYDAATVELDTALAVKTAYYQALLAQRYVDAYQSRVDEASERVRIAREAFDAGRIARYDLLRDHTDLAEAQRQLNDAQRDVETALIDLRNTMGVSQLSQITLAQGLAVRPSPPAFEELQAAAPRQRPEVQAAQARVRSAQADVGVAGSAYKPQVYATAMADLSIMRGDSINGNTDTGYLVGVTAALPVLDGGLRRSSVDEARAALARMQADERDAVLSVSKSVATAYVAFGAATKNVDLSQAAIAQADEDYRVIKMRYEAGKATNVEVLDALASLTRARTMSAEALYAQNVAREALTRAVGQR